MLKGVYRLGFRVHVPNFEAVLPSPVSTFQAPRLDLKTCYCLTWASEILLSAIAILLVLGLKRSGDRGRVALPIVKTRFKQSSAVVSQFLDDRPIRVLNFFAVGLILILRVVLVLVFKLLRCHRAIGLNRLLIPRQAMFVVPENAGSLQFSLFPGVTAVRLPYGGIGPLWEIFRKRCIESQFVLDGVVFTRVVRLQASGSAFAIHSVQRFRLGRSQARHVRRLVRIFAEQEAFHSPFLMPHLLFRADIKPLSRVVDRIVELLLKLLAKIRQVFAHTLQLVGSELLALRVRIGGGLLVLAELLSRLIQLLLGLQLQPFCHGQPLDLLLSHHSVDPAQSRGDVHAVGDGVGHLGERRTPVVVMSHMGPELGTGPRRGDALGDPLENSDHRQFLLS